MNLEVKCLSVAVCDRWKFSDTTTGFPFWERERYSLKVPRSQCVSKEYSRAHARSARLWWNKWTIGDVVTKWAGSVFGMLLPRYPYVGTQKSSVSSNSHPTSCYHTFWDTDDFSGTTVLAASWKNLSEVPALGFILVQLFYGHLGNGETSDRIYLFVVLLFYFTFKLLPL